MKLKILFFLCFSCTILCDLEGKDPVKKVEAPPVSTLQFQLINDQIATLMADRLSGKINITGEELAVIDDYLFDEMVEFESMVFPADELYGGAWDTTWVNPFRNREIIHPDSFFVDCTTFMLPIDQTIKVTSVFGVRGRRMHSGIDLKVQKGDTIRSAFNGKVRIKGFERRGYGNYLVIRHPNGLETLYAHLSGFLVTDNEIVKAGQPIGLGGNTGRSTGTHLHFETRFLGQALNPSAMIDFDNGGIPRNDQYALYRASAGKNTNIYTSSNERIVYHRVKSGETLGKIALQYKTSVAELCRLNGLTQTSVLRIGQTIRCGTTFVSTASKETDTSIAKASSETKASEKPIEYIGYHEVKQGETLFSISRSYNTSVTEICRLNGITEKDVLRVGQNLRLNESQALSSTASVTTANLTAPASQTSPMSQSTQPEPTQPVYHKIKEGDTLSAIAQKHGISINQLCELNNITKTTILRIGRSLRCS